MNKPFQPSVPQFPVYIPLYALPHRVDILRAVVLKDDAGGRIPSFPSISVANVPCAISEASSDEKLIFQRLDIVISHMVSFVTDPLLQSGDRLTFRNITNPKQDRILDVLSIANKDELNVLWIAATKEILIDGEEI